MNKTILTLIIMFHFSLFSQVGIGTTTPNGALEIKSLNQGIILPRVALTSKNLALPIINPQGGVLLESTLVYNTATSGVYPNDVSPGYYFWDGAKWKQLSDSSGSSISGYWTLYGNTIDSDDFIGTLNYMPFNIKSNSIINGSFYPGGSVYLGVNSSGLDSNSFAIGFGAKSNAAESYAFGSDAVADNWRSVAIGSNSNAKGAYSFAIGNFAKTGPLAANSVAIGYNSFVVSNEGFALGSSSTSSGDNSIAIGFNSLSSSSQALAIGSSAVASNTGSTAIGKGALSSGLNSTAIGYNASTSQSNAIVLGNSSDPNTFVGIGTSIPNAKLHIVSSVASNGFQLQDGNQGVGKVLVSDAVGKSTWKDLQSDQSIGELIKSSNSNLNSGLISLGSNSVNINISYGSDYIQVNKNGLYKVSYQVGLQKNATAGLVSGYCYLTNWGAEYPNTRAYFSLNSNENNSVSFTKFIYLNAWQSISLYSSLTNANITVLSNGTNLSVEFIR